MTKAELKALSNNTFKDNDDGLITPVKVRTYNDAVIETIPENLPPIGTAGGDLDGTYPNPTIGDLKITTPKVANGAITNAKIASSSVDNTKMLWAGSSVAFGPNAQITESGSHAVVIGYLASASTASVALGASATVTANYAIAIGYSAKIATGGTNAIAIGSSASALANSVAIGYSATTSGSNTVAIGYAASANNNSTAIGYNATASGSNSIAIGYVTSAGVNSIRLGNSSITTFQCQVSLTTTSDINDKIDIVDGDRQLARDIIMGLRPVEYKANPRDRYAPIDDEGIPISGCDEDGNLINYDREAHQSGIKKSSRTNVGFIAQDVQVLLKSLTGSDAYGAMVLDTSFDNDKITQDGRQMGLAYEKLISIIVTVVQDQQKEINEIKTLLHNHGII